MLQLPNCTYTCEHLSLNVTADAFKITALNQTRVAIPETPNEPRKIMLFYTNTERARVHYENFLP